MTNERKMVILTFVILIISAVLIMAGCRRRVIIVNYDGSDTTEATEETISNVPEETQETSVMPTIEPMTEPSIENPTESVTEAQTENLTEPSVSPPTEQITEPPTEKPKPTEKPTESQVEPTIDKIPATESTTEPPPKPTEKHTEVDKVEVEVNDEGSLSNISYVSPTVEDVGMSEIQEEAENIDEAAGEDESAELTITVIETSDKGEEAAISDDGGAVGTIIDEYAAFLDQGFGALYECQKGYIFLEGTADYQTFNKSSDEHLLITEAGGYNVAEKLNGESLTVDDKWVLRKNPTVIVKCVGGDTLGAGVNDTTNAEAVWNSITTRSEWSGISAVINRDVILLSEELFATEEGRLLAKLHIAEIIYPTLFEDMDINDVYLQIKESGGRDFTDGIYVY